MSVDNYIKTNIKYAVPNLRFRWKEELKGYSDEAIARMYTHFGQSEDFGNNDEKLPEWFSMLPDYENECTGIKL